MYTVSITSNSGKVVSWTYVDLDYAMQDFEVGITCIDLKSIYVYNATTGEICAGYDGEKFI